MNWIDVIVFVVLAVGVVGGVAKGLLRAVFGLAGVVFGFLVASRESGGLAATLSQWMRDEAAQALGFVLVFVGIIVIFMLLAWLLRKVLEGLSLSWVDRLLGGGLGFLQAGAVLAVLALVVEGLGSFPATRRSLTFPYVLEGGRVLLSLVPEETLERLDWDSIRPRLREGMEKVDEVI